MQNLFVNKKKTKIKIKLKLWKYSILIIYHNIYMNDNHSHCLIHGKNKEITNM